MNRSIRKRSRDIRQLTLSLPLFILVLLPACEGNSVTQSNRTTHPAPTSSADATWETFRQSLATADEELAKSVCEQQFWSTNDDSGSQFFEQAVRKKFTLQLKNRQLVDDRACFTTDILRDGKVVDTVHFYLRKSTEWRLVAWDEDDDHVVDFLAGG